MLDRSITPGTGEYALREGVNIYEYPDKINTHPDGSVITIGDLHGNAAKFLHILVREGILKISPQYYKNFIDVYKDSDLIYDNKLENTKIFIDLLNHISIMQPCPKLRLVGDDLADRGKNDFFTILLYKKLVGVGVEFDVMASNHGMEFLNQYSYGLSQKSIIAFQDENANQAASLYGLMNDITSGMLREKDINTTIQQFYLPHIKLLSYSFSDEDTIVIYSHAPINAKRIQFLAESLNVIPDLKSMDSLVKTIDEINAAFLKIITDISSLDTFMDNYRYNSKFKDFVWGRQEIVAEESATLDFKVYNVHGHLGEYPIDNKSVNNNWTYVNLDNFLGRPGDDFLIRDYPVFVSTEYEYDLENVSTDSFDFSSDSDSSDSDSNESDSNVSNSYIDKIGEYMQYLNENLTGSLAKVHLMKAVIQIHSNDTVLEEEKITGIFTLLNSTLEKEKAYYDTPDPTLSFKIMMFQQKKIKFADAILDPNNNDNELALAKTLSNLLINIYAQYKNILPSIQVERAVKLQLLESVENPNHVKRL